MVGKFKMGGWKSLSSALLQVSCSPQQAPAPEIGPHFRTAWVGDKGAQFLDLFRPFPLVWFDQSWGYYFGFPHSTALLFHLLWISISGGKERCLCS